MTNSVNLTEFLLEVDCIKKMKVATFLKV